MAKIVNIEENDILYGNRRSACSCPIARALKRTFPGKGCSVTVDSIRIGEKRFFSNNDMRQFVLGFDEGFDVKPFSFDFDSLTLIPTINDQDN